MYENTPKIVTKTKIPSFSKNVSFFLKHGTKIDVSKYQKTAQTQNAGHKIDVQKILKKSSQKNKNPDFFKKCQFL